MKSNLTKIAIVLLLILTTFTSVYLHNEITYLQETLVKADSTSNSQVRNNTKVVLYNIFLNIKTFNNIDIEKFKLLKYEEVKVFISDLVNKLKTEDVVKIYKAKYGIK